MDIKCVYVYYICIFLRNREWYAECVYWTEPRQHVMLIEILPNNVMYLS